MEKFFTDQIRQSKKIRAGDKSEQRDDGVTDDAPPKKFPKGVVLGKDGKPCRSCTSYADFSALTKTRVSPSSSSSSSSSSTSSTPTTSTSTPPSASTSSLSPPPDCPPDVEQLGRSTWTLLHTISATYPAAASPTQQSEMRQFLSLFAKLYPCWVCAEDFGKWMREKGNEPRVEGREGLGRWMCEAHNEVNRKLGKEGFDCGRWEERWRTGWRDGRCD